jgi:DNA-binding response OmpR family regulator
MAKKILIIEDEIHVSNYLEDIFKDNGYETVTASNIELALDIVDKEKPDLITLDLQMPQGHGTRFYQQIRKDDDKKEIPIVVISGQSSPHRAIKPNKAAAIVPKPFEPAQLIEVVENVIGPA